MIRIYEIRTEQKDTRPGHSYDRFNVAASSFAEAVKKANRKLAKDWQFLTFVPEKIQAIHVLAVEGKG